MKKLYAVYLGGKINKDSFIEDHEIVFVVAENDKEARKLGKEKWKAEDVHVDGTKMLENIDGFLLELKQNDKQDVIVNNNKYSQ